MSSAVNMIRRGKFNGTGSAKSIVLGFKPAKVELYNESGLATADKSDTMDLKKAFKRVTAGTLTFADVCTITSDGFTLEADGDMNVSGETVHYVAYQARNDA